MANFARRGVASDLEYLKIHLRPHFLRRTKLARIAAEDTFEMGSGADINAERRGSCDYPRRSASRCAVRDPRLSASIF